jgi:hypothetical protein
MGSFLSKAITLCSFTLLSFCSFAQDTSAILRAAQVLPTSQASIEKSQALLQSVFKGQEPALTLFNRFVFIGPRLWGKVKELPQFSGIKNGNVTYKVPLFKADGSWNKTVGVEGKALQTNEDFNNLWQYLANHFAIATAQSVASSARDNFLYWLYYAKVDASLLVYATSNARLMFTLMDNKNLLFIELSSD